MVSRGVAPPPILVIGMHRSGTSATTGLLAHLGVNLGAPERLQPGDVHNPEGYHELQDAVALNDGLLDWCGSAWDLPPKLGDPHLGQLQPPPDLVAQLKQRRTRERQEIPSFPQKKLCTKPGWLQLPCRCGESVVLPSVNLEKEQ